MVMKERDEELVLFLEMRRREKENEKNNLLLLPQNSDDLHGSVNLESMTVNSTVHRKIGADEFLNSENEKSDYEWLLTPPDTPLFPTLDKESQISVNSENEIPTARSTALKPRPANVQSEPASKTNLSSKHHAASVPGLNFSSTASNRRTTSVTSRSVTPSGRPALPSTTKYSRSSTPTSRATVSSAKPVAPPVRSSTPTGTRATAPPVRSSTPTGTRATAPPARSSTPTGNRATARASTPTSRPSLAAPKTTRRSSTPTLRSSTPSSANAVSAPASRSSSASKERPAQAKNPVQSRGNSPSIKSRPSPSQMPGFSLEGPPNLKTSLPERPASASRTRPGAPNSRSSSLEAAANGNGKSKRQSGTPSRGRASTVVAQSNHSSIQTLSRSRFTDGDNDSPVVVGTKMVERVVNMRKLAPPKHEDRHSAHSSSGKSSSSEGAGFGRTLSKMSLDMAMRHMDIRRSIKGNNLKPLVTSIPASSMYSVRSSGSSNSRTMNVSDSPLATSSTASSEPSVNFNSISYDGSEIEENDLACERGNSSPVSHLSR